MPLDGKISSSFSTEAFNYLKEKNHIMKNTYFTQIYCL